MGMNISLPTLDETGDLTPLVLAALEAGATAELDANDPHNTLVVTFSKAADARAFETKIAAILGTVEVPVAPEPEAPAAE